MDWSRPHRRTGGGRGRNGGVLTSRRGFLRSLLTRSGVSLPQSDPGAGARRRPPEPVAATPERLSRAFAVPEDQRDIATELVHRGYAELLPDGRFCTARDFIVRSASAPLPPAVAAWLARAQGGSPLDAARPADAGTISAARTELTRPGT